MTPKCLSVQIIHRFQRSYIPYSKISGQLFSAYTILTFQHTNISHSYAYWVQVWRYMFDMRHGRSSSKGRRLAYSKKITSSRSSCVSAKVLGFPTIHQPWIRTNQPKSSLNTLLVDHCSSAQARRKRLPQKCPRMPDHVTQNAICREILPGYSKEEACSTVPCLF